MTADIYIVRHGNTFDPGETLLRVGARTDLPLSVSGAAQAERLGRFFQETGVTFVSVRSGPLLRTRQTAEAICAHQAGEVDVGIDPFLREIDYGPDEGVPETDVIARLGTDCLRDWEEAGKVPSGWLVDPPALEAAWRTLFNELRFLSGAHLVVTSNGVARFARSAMGDRGPGKLATGAYGLIRVNDGVPLTLAWNQRP